MRVRLWFLLPPLVVALAVVFAACGGGDDDGAGPEAEEMTPAVTQEPSDDGEDGGASALDACTLITKAEAEAALGKSVGEGEALDFPPVYNCTYTSEDFDLVNVSVLVYDDAGQAEDGFQMAIDINDYPEVDGLGDGAYDARPIFGITVLKGKYELSIDVSADDADADFEMAMDLAEKVLGRLP